MRQYLLTTPAPDGSNTPLGEVDNIADARFISKRSRRNQPVDIWLNEPRPFFIGSCMNGELR